MQGSCDGSSAALGGCARPSTSAGVNGGTVDVSAEVRTEGVARGGGGAPAPRMPAVAPSEVVPGQQLTPDCVTAPQTPGAICRDNFTVTIDGTDIPWQPITIADIESFRPTLPALAAEPDGWAVIDRPANFVARTQQQIVPGILLGEPAEVRFTPIEYTWDYGDGTARATSEAGASWEELGLDELTETPTSHTYKERGRVTALLTVTYAAEYRFLGPAWIPVIGTLDVSTSPFPVSVVSADTMLVSGDCTTTDGPGC